MQFYLGTHMSSWLDQIDVPLFVSHRRLFYRKRLPVAINRWALDSGGFTELSMYGEWRTSPSEYIEAVKRYRDEIGHMDWAAPQDAMCEPFILEKSKAWLGGTVLSHQRWTIDNYLELRSLDATLPFIPVLQGFTLDDYKAHRDMYGAAGVDLGLEATVGIGSVCRRQATSEINEIMTEMSKGINLHGFGVKTSGIRTYGRLLTSADSLAWSYRGRRVKPCPHTGMTSCNNCRWHALEWRKKLLKLIP